MLGLIHYVTPMVSVIPITAVVSDLTMGCLFKR